ncbi:DUF6338 family protein [Candidatus Nanohalovita haloferacivicina]|uniref:DUF6338 family protein n=1 Tax=Candidatus Nanohalovita haloferacivicina TaxID=2978046 RepID=UPI00325FD59C|nr:hypothetical protein HBNXNv_0837 [Candidatus Nanohalobia archaeon BNXNv]
MTIPGLILAFLFLTPGFLAIKLARKFGHLDPLSDRFDKTAFSLLLSGFSAAFVLMTINLLGIAPEFVIEDFNFSIENLGFLSKLYVGHLVSGSILGYILGIILKEDGSRKETPFNLTFRYMEEGEQGSKIKAKMKDGRLISGYLRAWDDRDADEDLLIKFPRILESSNGPKWESGRKLGKYMYINGENISEVFFEADIKFPE